MPKYIKELTLDISGKRNNQIITAKQLDNKARLIRITLVDDETKVTLEQGENVDFRCLKPDKKSCRLPATIEDDGTVLVELDDNVLAVAGCVRADVEINNADGLVLSSTSFYIQVEPSATNGVNIPSTSNQKMARQLDMNGHSIKNLPDPVDDGDAVNKQYFENAVGDVAKNYVDDEIADVLEVFDKSVNLYNEKTNLNYKEVSDSTGILHDNAVWAVTQPILLKKGQYTITHDRDNNRHFGYVSFYGMDMVFDKKVSLVSGVPVDTEKKVASLVIEQNCYARFSGIIDRITGTELMIVRGTELPTEYVPYKNEMKAKHLPIDTEMSDESTNPVQNKVAKAYTDNNTVVNKYYSVDITTFKNQGVLAYNTSVNSLNMSFALSIVLIVCENEVAQPLTDMPFKFQVGFTNSIVLNKDNFKSIGITSPILEELYDVSYLSFETLAQLLCTTQGNSYDVKIEYDERKEFIVLNVGLSVEFQYSDVAENMKNTVDTILNSPDTKLVFLFQNQENIETQEATYQFSIEPIINDEV